MKKRKLVTLLVVALCVLSLTIGAIAKSAVQKMNADIQTEPRFIGEEKAKAIALGKAGFTSSEVRFDRVEPDRDNGKLVYEVEFKSGGYEYEAEIDAKDGSVLKWEKDLDD